MALWNNTNREESKPTWLNPAQKINCVRTKAGWELPLDGTSLGGQQAGKLGTTASSPFTELLVCLPLDPSVTGVTNTNFMAAIVATGGLTFATDTPNYAPYFTCPFNGDGPTTGGIGNAGLSFAASLAGSGTTGVGYYAVNGYGVSTLNFPASATAFIKIVANDSNFTQNLAFSERTDPMGAQASIVSGAQLLDPLNVPTSVYEAFFGPTSGFNNNIAVLKINRAGATAAASRVVTLRVTDNGTGGLTADTTFTVAFG
jgi:hypothetical protein